jgi:outer membrane biosynthesis protein TonB
MRLPAAISGALHIGLLVLLTMPITFGRRDIVELPPVIPVELLEVAETTNIKASQKAPEPEEEPQAAPEPVEETPPPPKIAERTPVPEPEPEPAAEPAPPVLKPKPQAEPEPEPEPKAEETPPQLVEAPRPKPTPPKPVPAKPQAEAPKAAEKPKDDYFDRVAALLDKMPQKDEAPADAPADAQPSASDISVRSAGLGTGLTLSEIDALRTQIEKCWTVPAGAPYAEELIVTLRVRLNQDGSLSSAPEIVDQVKYRTSPNRYYRVAVDSAVRAVLRCAPYSMPVEKYDVWRTVMIDFDPRHLLAP